MVGVTVGTALMVIVLSVFNGFFGIVQEMLQSYDPDIRVTSAEYRSFSENPALLDSILAHPDVTMAYPYVEGKSLLSSGTMDNKVVVVRGIDQTRFFPYEQDPNMVTLGSFNLNLRDRKPGILVGERLLDNLRLTVGDDMGLIAAHSLSNMFTSIGASGGMRFTIRGGYLLKPIFDGSIVFVDIKAGQVLMKERGKWTGIDINLRDNTLADKVRADLNLPTSYKVETWYDLRRSIYDVMYAEKWGAYAILLLIVIVAVFNIVGSLSMIVVQKQRDLGVLRSMGFSISDIRMIFVQKGAIVGLIGSVLGGGMGLLASWIQQEFGLVKLFGAESFIIDAYPIVIVASDVAIILGGSFLLCLIAASFPASRAAKVQPASAIRYE